MARTGLRMMPTSPSSPLRFRTVGFPQYGSKAGLSDGAFPHGLRPSFAVSAAGNHPRSASRLRSRLIPPPCERLSRSTPGALATVRVMLSRSIKHLIGPMCPAGRHGTTSPPCGLYAPPSLCGLNTRLGSRPVVPSFRCTFLPSMSPYSCPGESIACASPVLRPWFRLHLPVP